jgi:hypothetical protein
MFYIPRVRQKRNRSIDFCNNSRTKYESPCLVGDVWTQAEYLRIFLIFAVVIRFRICVVKIRFYTATFVKLLL